MTATEQNGVAYHHPLVRQHLLSQEAQRFAHVDETPVFGLVKQNRDLLPILRGNFPQVGWTEMIWMFVAEPDMRDIAKIFVRKLCRGEQVPTIVKCRSLQPGIANETAAS